MQLHDHEAAFTSLDVDLVAIGPSADYQARRLVDRGVTHDLLLDPDKAFRAGIGLGKLRARDWVRPATATNYLRTIRNGRQGRMGPGNIDDLPGVLLADRDGRLLRRWDGTTLGDYPPVANVLAVVREAT